MAARRRTALGARAEECGILIASLNVPLTFQRTLMPRTTVDQALVTGLSVTTNQALVTLIQESIQAGALVVARRLAGRDVDERRWSRAAILADGAMFGTGLLMQRLLRQRRAEPLPRAAARTAGFWLSVTGGAGMAAGALEAPFERTGRRLTSLALVIPATAAVAGVGEYGRRRRARLDVALAPQDAEVAPLRALAFGCAVAAGSSGFAAAERYGASAIGRVIARVLPGDAAVWRPIGHVISLSVLVGVGRLATQQVYARITSKEEAVEMAFDIPPPIPVLSGHETSLVKFETLALQGRRFVWMTTARDVIEHVTGEPAVAQPIRTYVGLESADTEQARVDLALRELDRTGAFDRRWLMVVSPTGTGYVNYAAVSALEFLSAGDCATIAMQYSARPSPLSLDRVSEGRTHMDLLLAGIKQRLDARGTQHRPTIVLFGESLGAWTSQDPFVGKGTKGLVDLGIDHAIWIGTPHFSKWKEQVLRDKSELIDQDLVGVFNDIEQWNATDPAVRERMRFVMITHHDDGVALFGPELTIQAPEWLGAPDTRPSGIPKGMRWVPTTAFFQVLTDMKNAAQVVPGVFAAKGHDYRADLLPFFDATLGFKKSFEQLDAISSWLETRELERSEWIREHGHAGRSLAATVLQGMREQARAAGRDPDLELIHVLRDAAADEFAAGGIASTISVSEPH